MNCTPWVEKYRPTNFEDIVLENDNRILLKNIIDNNHFPNLLLYGPPGTGKTTTIINIIKKYNNTYKQNLRNVIHLNASDDRGLFSDGSSLDNGWFNTLMDMNVKWTPTGSNSYEAHNRSSGEKVRRATRYDLVFGSNSQLRAIAEVYAQDDNKDKFVSDFIAAWNKVMNADRF